MLKYYNPVYVNGIKIVVNGLDTRILVLKSNTDH